MPRWSWIVLLLSVAAVEAARLPKAGGCSGGKCPVLFAPAAK